MKPDRNLWWDVQKRKWYSHPDVRREDARDFMERQLAAGSACAAGERSLLPAGRRRRPELHGGHGRLGILDYALNFAPSL